MNKQNKLVAILIVSGLLLFGATVTFVWYTGFATLTNNDLNDYSQQREKYILASNVMPAINTLPNYTNISYEFRKSQMLLFEANTLLLSVAYEENVYQAEKKKIEGKQFLHHTVSPLEDGVYTIPEYNFFINSFNFKVLDSNSYNTDNEYEFDYPKVVEMIATSNEKNTVVYLYFYDSDLDNISDENVDNSPNPMKDFITNYFNYAW